MSVDSSVRTGRVVGAGRRPTAPLPSLIILAGAALLMASAVIHLHLWASGYRNIRTIGPLFFVQGVFGIMLALSVALVRRISISLLGTLFSVGTMVGQIVAVNSGLFGYRTTMAAPWATTSLVIETTAAVLLLAGGCLAVWEERAHVRRWRAHRTPES
jgi:uncharacterized membrane protein HdeD (DUF308 family)